MAQPPMRPQTPNRSTAPARQPQPPIGATPTELLASVQYLVFEPGLYTLEVAASKPSPTDLGLQLPCVRLENLPSSPARPGRITIAAAQETGWIWQSNEPAVVLVVGGRSGAMLTTYRANDGMGVPEIRITRVPTGNAAAGEPMPTRGDSARGEDGDPESAVRVAKLAHVSGMGDMQATSGQWLGRPGSGKPIEGFALTPDAPVTSDLIEYQAILGNNWNTPWFRGGEFCGSRGLMLPLLGFRIQLKGRAADDYECRYWGQFVGGRIVGPISGGAACLADEAPLEAFRMVIARKSSIPRAAPQVPQSAAAAKSPAPKPKEPKSPAKASARGVKPKAASKPKPAARR